jgi:hypothetical protein
MCQHKELVVGSYLFDERTRSETAVPLIIDKKVKVLSHKDFFAASSGFEVYNMSSFRAFFASFLGPLASQHD